MKIIIFAPYFYPHKGGVENFCMEISTRLAHFGNDVTIITSRLFDEIENENLNSVNIVRLATKNLLGGTFPFPVISKKNVRIIINNIKGADCVIINTRFFLLSLYGLIIAKYLRIKSFHIEHGTCHPSLTNVLSSFCAWLYDQTLGRMVFVLADNHLAISQAAANFSEKLGAKNVKIVYNSVDTNLFKPLKRNNRDKSLVLIYVGRLIEAKGVQVLIKAFKQINEKNCCLMIVGTGNYEEQLKLTVNGDDRIKFLGQQNRPEIISLLQQSDIFINPSFAEGLPTSVLEAAACELSLIATDVGGTCEIIHNKKDGFLVEPNNVEDLKNKLKLLIKDDDLRAIFSKKIRIKIEERFSWDKNVSKLLTIIRGERG